MTGLPIQDVFESLAAARWDVAHRTYGSSHSTLIGLMVDWWISLSHQSHTVLDGAPSFEGNKGQGDAVFCRDSEPVGVLEVEGPNPLAKAATIVRYFETQRPELKTIKFGILFVYAYIPKVSGKIKQYRSTETLEIAELLKQATASNPDRAIIAVNLDKSFSRIRTGIRSTSEYYSGTTNRVGGVLYVGGQEMRRDIYFDASL